MRVLALVATFGLARLDLEPHPYLWGAGGVAIVWTVVGTRPRDYEVATTSSSIASAESGAPQSSSEAGAGKL